MAGVCPEVCGLRPEDRRTWSARPERDPRPALETGTEDTGTEDTGGAETGTTDTGTADTGEASAIIRRGGLTGRRPGTVRGRRRRSMTRAVLSARSAASRSVASYRRTSAGASASSPAAARTARSTEVGTRTPSPSRNHNVVIRGYGPVVNKSARHAQDWPLTRCQRAS